MYTEFAITQTVSTDAAIVLHVFNSVTRSRAGNVKVNEWSGKHPRLGLG
jgi:hypothetical protein